MKDLNLSACNVQAMSFAEMRQVEGGNWLRTLVKVLEWCGAIDFAYEICDAFTEGVGEGYKAQQNK
jgi:hypothetical protein